ncbi:hypothetical protein E4U41_001352, partial [Claviceps citrina]
MQAPPPRRLAIQPAFILLLLLRPPHPRAFAFFHASPVRAANAAETKNHYERLNLRPDASPGEIK